MSIVDYKKTLMKESEAAIEKVRCLCAKKEYAQFSPSFFSFPTGQADIQNIMMRCLPTRTYLSDISIL